jgi:hypothetical protein
MGSMGFIKLESLIQGSAARIKSGEVVWIDLIMVVGARMDGSQPLRWGGSAGAGSWCDDG